MKKGMANKTKKVLNILFVILVIIGFGLMFYPWVSNFFYKITASSVIQNYTKDFVDASKEEKKKIIEDAQKYNENTLNYKIDDIFETDKVSKDEVYESLLNFNNDGMMGIIEIPKINVNLPIYHGTSDDVLNKGVGHLKGTSLPVGGKSTHAVLAAHRGLPSAKLFTDLNLLEKKDHFYIRVVDELLTYEIDSIKVIEPQDINSLNISNGKDYVTLVTCTPYAVNSHRLLVRGKRVENDKNIIDNVKTVNYIPLIVVIASMIITGGLIIVVNKKYPKIK